MYAIIESGGKQLCVSKGDRVKVEKLNAEKGDEVTFPVLLVSGDDTDTLIGTPTVEGACAKGKVVAQAKARKIIVFHYKPKRNYRKKAGHRQPYTDVEITEIVTGSAAPAAQPANVDVAQGASEAAETE